MTDRDPDQEDFIHEVRSKCATLMEAAERVRGAPRAETSETLTLMLTRAERVAELIRERLKASGGRKR